MNENDELANAIEHGDGGTVQSILSQHPELVNSPHWTPPPLHCAVLWDQPGIAEILLDHGANIEMKDPDQHSTPLRYAIVFGRDELIPLLLSRGANAGPITEGGKTALQLAIDAAAGEFDEYDDLPSREEYSGIVELLKSLGGGGETPCDLPD